VGGVGRGGGVTWREGLGGERWRGGILGGEGRDIGDSGGGGG